MNVVILDSKYWSEVEGHGVKKQDVETTIREAVNEVVELNPLLPSYVNLVVSPTRPENVIPETGDSGMTYGDDYSSVFFDYSVPFGREKLLKHLRETTFHELAHATTFQYEPWQPSALFGVVTEGLATVFERDYAGATPLWGEYEHDETMRLWLSELKELPDTGEKNHAYFIKHPDGRKWVVYKTGVWVVDKLLDSGQDLFKLMKLDHKTLLAKFETLHG